MPQTTLLLLAAPLLLTACSRADRDGPLEPARDVVLVVFDTTRHDRTSIGGNRQARNPALDRLAAEGVVFERAYAPVPITLPSHATLLTGRSPLVHGIRQNGMTALDGSLPRVTESFRAAGFATAAFVSTVVLDARFGLDRGFDVYSAPALAERPARQTVAEAIAWLEQRDRTGRLFLWVHFYDPHYPYEPPGEFADLPPYDGEIAAADAALGHLLDALDDLGRLDGALVVVAADHGEGLDDHGEAEHGIFLYEETIRVPLVIKLPGGARGGRRVPGVVRLEDVAPTLLARAGLPPLAPVEGADLTPLLEGHGAAARGAYAESWIPHEVHGFAPLFAWVEGPYKYVEAPQPELYDLGTDPAERRNILDRDGAAGIHLAAALAEHRSRLAGEARPGASVALSAQERSRFQELGYLGGARAAADRLIDPKDGIRIFNHLRDAAALIESAPDVALAEIEQVLRADPRNRGAMVHLQRALVRLGRTGEAIARWRPYLRDDSDFLEGWLQLGSLLGPEHPAEAERCFRQALRLEPLNFEANYNLAQALRQQGDSRGALDAYQQALAIDRSGQSLNALAWHLATAPDVRDPERALGLAREAVRLEPEAADYHDTLAEALALTGEFAAAAEAIREAFRLSPRPEFLARLRAFEKRAED